MSALFPDLTDYSGISCPWLTVEALTAQISDWGNYSVTVESENSVKVWDHDNSRHVILETPLPPFYFTHFHNGAKGVAWIGPAGL